MICTRTQAYGSTLDKFHEIIIHIDSFSLLYLKQEQNAHKVCGYRICKTPDLLQMDLDGSLNKPPKHYLIQGCTKMARGKCPSCKQVVSELVIDAHIAGRVHASKSLRCINFLCPNCSTVVGSQMDPVPVRTQTVDLLMQKLRYVS